MIAFEADSDTVTTSYGEPVTITQLPTAQTTPGSPEWLDNLVDEARKKGYRVRLYPQGNGVWRLSTSRRAFVDISLVGGRIEGNPIAIEDVLDPDAWIYR